MSRRSHRRQLPALQGKDFPRGRKTESNLLSVTVERAPTSNACRHTVGI